MKFSFRTSVVSVRFIIVAVVALAIIFRSTIDPSMPFITAALIVALLLTLLVSANIYLIFRPAQQIIQQAVATLTLMGLKHRLLGRRLLVEPTGTVIAVFGLASFGIMRFRLSGSHRKREEYVMRTILKYQNMQ